MESAKGEWQERIVEVGEIHSSAVLLLLHTSRGGACLLGASGTGSLQNHHPRSLFHQLVEIRLTATGIFAPLPPRLAAPACKQKK